MIAASSAVSDEIGAPSRGATRMLMLMSCCSPNMKKGAFVFEPFAPSSRGDEAAPPASPSSFVPFATVGRRGAARATSEFEFDSDSDVS